MLYDPGLDVSWRRNQCGSDAEEQRWMNSIKSSFTNNQQQGLTSFSPAAIQVSLEHRLLLQQRRKTMTSALLQQADAAAAAAAAIVQIEFQNFAGKFNWIWVISLH